VAFDQNGPRWLGISDLIAEPEGPTFISYKVGRSRVDRLRFVTQDPRTTSALLAISGIVAVYIVPNLKYPANPPSVGDPETVGMRTALYFAMIAISLAALIASWMLRNRLAPQYGRWNAGLIAAAAYLIVVVAVGLALPAVNEVPEAFPAVVLWQFRIASAGAQLVMWSTIGLGFGALAESATASQSGLRLKATTF
jgi:putative cobalt transporter subunit CbtA